MLIGTDTTQVLIGIVIYTCPKIKYTTMAHDIQECLVKTNIYEQYPYFT